MNAISKYLKNYAEKEISFSKAISKKFDACVVVPAHREDEYLFQFLSSLKLASKNRSILCILVLNGKESEQDFHQKILNKLEASLFSEFQLFIVDRATGKNIFSDKEGVGLARKIGCDLALQLIVENKILSPWIRCSDADVLLPSDYFDDPNFSKSTSAFHYSFFHQPENSHIQDALSVYEESLNYYLWGLNFANSAYAFHSVGSTIGIHYEKYAEVRGFPKVEAGEDFYVLNKLAKVGRIEISPTSPICISGRASDRVPFGTGAGIQKILETWQDKKEFCFYHPEIFLGLKVWLQELALCEQNISIEDLKSRLENQAPIGSQCIEVAEQLGLFEALRRLPLKPHSPPINREHLRTWFDGFKTLKFLHCFRDLHRPSISYLEALYLAEPMGYKAFICKQPPKMTSALT